MLQPNKLAEFRTKLYTTLPFRRDALMDLIDALCSSTQARSVVELSLEPAFRRTYSSLHDAIDTLFTPSAPHLEMAERWALERRFRRVVAPIIEPPEATGNGRWWHLSLDALPLSRPNARCLYDRGWVYQPTPVPGMPPLTVGHQYSLLTALPPREPTSPAWTVPLSIRRVATHDSAVKLGVNQVHEVLDDDTLPWFEQPVVLTADSGYAHAAFLSRLQRFSHLITVTRLRSNRVLYRSAPPPEPGTRGRPRRYGARFALRDRSTWDTPDEETRIPYGAEGAATLHIQSWYDLRMKGARNAPMHDAPFTLLRAVVLEPDGSTRPRTLKWLIVVGADRRTLPPEIALALYVGRFDIEHGIRFAKQKLHLADYQTCETEHEENWLMLVGLAMAQLYAARPLAVDLPRPWEHRRPVDGPDAPPALSPSRVQRAFPRILSALGTPAQAPKPRGNAKGRALGACPDRRMRRPIVSKGKARRNRARAPTAHAA